VAVLSVPSSPEALTVRVVEPEMAVLSTVIVRVEPKVGVPLEGEKLVETPVGAPVAVRVTFWL